MCNNIIVLWLFIILKIVAIIILPIIMIIKRKSNIFKILLSIDLILLLFILISNIFVVNSCVYNSSISGINRTNSKNDIILYNNIRPSNDIDYDSSDIIPRAYYKTYNNKNFYYYNQNDKAIGTKKLSCSLDEKYMNKYGAPFTATAMALSTITDSTVTPVDLLNLYISKGYNCEQDIDIENLFRSILSTYGAYNILSINSTDVLNSIKQGGMVIAEINGNKDSNLSCGKSYIVIYNITLENKLIIADPDDSEYDYVCSYSSPSYGNTIKANRTNSEYSFEELNKFVTKYYVIRGVQ